MYSYLGHKERLRKKHSNALESKRGKFPHLGSSHSEPASSMAMLTGVDGTCSQPREVAGFRKAALIPAPKPTIVGGERDIEFVVHELLKSLLRFKTPCVF